MPKAWWPVIAGLPLVVCLAVLFLAEGLRDWRALPRAVIAGVFADALLVNALVLIVAAPLAGVSIAQQTTAANRIALDLAGVMIGFVGVSALLSLAGWGLDPGPVRAVARSHITLAAGGMALGTLGAWCGLLFRDPLDGAAVSVGTAVLAGTGVLLAGPYVSDAPQRLIDGALLASPLVTTAAAADIDILRADLLYRVSPLAHVNTTYPEWYVATGVYFVFTAVCLTGMVFVNRATRRRLA